MSGTLSVTGAVSDSVSLTLSMLEASYTPVTVTIGSGANAATYTGASVYSLISGANFLYPTGSSIKNGFLRDYIAVSAASGAQVVLSEGEIDPSFGGKATTDIIAYARNGVAIAPELIVPGDLGGGLGVRDISDVTGLSVGTAAVPAASSASSLTVTGDVSIPNSVYTAAALQQIGSVSQTDSFLAGSTATTTTFTGAPLASVLASAGQSPVNPLDDYVVATGSDDYGVVYSDGEIDPAIRGTPSALVAYNDGSGTFPSVGGVSGALRSTAPDDSKGGRYVSTLNQVSVATPNNDAVLRLYEGALGRAPEAAGSAFWSGLLDDGTMLTQAAQGILQSAEFQADGGAALNAAGFVNRLYADALGRSSDPSGFSFWTGLLNGGVSQAAVLAGFTSTAEAVLHGSTLGGPTARASA